MNARVLPDLKPEKSSKTPDAKAITASRPQEYGAASLPILRLQRNLGNRQFRELIQRSHLPLIGLGSVHLQTKLMVGAQGDAFEEEADRVSREVLVTPDGDPPTVFRTPMPDE